LLILFTCIIEVSQNEAETSTVETQVSRTIMYTIHQYWNCAINQRVEESPKLPFVSIQEAKENSSKHFKHYTTKIFTDVILHTLRETCINYTCVNFALIVEDNKSSEQKKPKRRKRKLINEKQGRKSSTNKGYTIIHCNVCLLNLKIYTENQEPIKGTKKSKKNGSKASKKKSGN